MAMDQPQHIRISTSSTESTTTTTANIDHHSPDNVGMPAQSTCPKGCHKIVDADADNDKNVGNGQLPLIENVADVKPEHQQRKIQCDSPDMNSTTTTTTNVLTKREEQLQLSADEDNDDAKVSTPPRPMSPALMASMRDEASGCVHYKRKAKFVTPCCGKFYKCRYCHDENEEHHFDRKTLTELICTQCDTRQKVQAECQKCGVRFGKYTCLICNLFDDEDKDQYHCHGCGICRLGGRSNFFHCEVCNMCLPIQLRNDGHKCVENISRSNCPVCLGDIHTSRIPCHIPDCGHLLHKTCFDQLLASGHYVCPTCQTSMIDMKKLWDYLDVQALNIPVPKSYQNSSVNIFCNDCFKQSTVKFHFVGLKCGYCGGYNTSQNMQKRTWNHSKDNPSTSA